MKANGHNHDVTGQAQKGDGSVSSTHSKPGARRKRLGSTTLHPLYPQERPVTNLQEAGLGSETVCTSRKMLPPPEFEPRTVKPDTSLNTDSTALAAIVLSNTTINYFRC
jgi:hypothetical protein